MADSPDHWPGGAEPADPALPEPDLSTVDRPLSPGSPEDTTEEGSVISGSWIPEEGRIALLVEHWSSTQRSLTHRLTHKASVVGMILGLFGFWTALTPSLISRTWWMTALSVVLSTLFAYGVGVLVGVGARALGQLIGLRITASSHAVTVMRRLGYAALLLITVVMWFWSIQQQRDISRTVELPRRIWWNQTIGAAVGLVAVVAMIALIRAVGHGVHRLYASVHRFIAQPAAAITVVAMVLVIVLIATNNVIVRAGANAAAGQRARLNQQTIAGAVRPTTALRSGSPASTEPWADLGREGQRFISNGPTASDISAVTGRPALEPIRVYAGLSHDHSLVEGARTVLAELIRTRAFDRKVLVLHTTTGAGWLEEWSVASVEYLTGGDCATASMQYSYLGSPGAFLLDRSSPQQGGKELLDVVRGYWATLDPAHRPKLYVTGVSLGSFGGQAAFSSIDDMMSKVDGAVWVGTPGFTPIWRQLTDSREQGSPEIAPEIDRGRHLRFIPSPAFIDVNRWGNPYTSWQSPRIAYVQHTSDPIVWWSPSLIWREPDWIRERAGTDVNPRIRWAPWSTFWQVTADMAIAVATPGGHGHSYHQELVGTWSQVLGVNASPAQITTIQDAVPRTIRAGD